MCLPGDYHIDDISDVKTSGCRCAGCRAAREVLGEPLINLPAAAYATSLEEARRLMDAPGVGIHALRRVDPKACNERYGYFELAFARAVRQERLRKEAAVRAARAAAWSAP